MAPLIAAVSVLSILAGWCGHAAHARQALRAARRDPVTGLPTRAAWTGQAAGILRGRGPHTVALVDLDRFKAVNDTYGHAAGDELLAVAAARMREWTDRVGGGACGRLGGDEFAIITRRAVTEAEAGHLAAALARPALLPGAGSLPAYASVGTAACTGRRGLSAGLAAADAAMYRAKRAGGGCAFAYQGSREPEPAEVPRARTRHHGPRLAADDERLPR